MKIATAFSYPVLTRDKWRPGSYRNRGGNREYRHFGVSQEKDGIESYHTGTDIELTTDDIAQCIADGIIVSIENTDSTGLAVIVKHQL